METLVAMDVAAAIRSVAVRESVGSTKGLVLSTCGGALWPLIGLTSLVAHPAPGDGLPPLYLELRPSAEGLPQTTVGGLGSALVPPFDEHPSGRLRITDWFGQILDLGRNGNVVSQTFEVYLRTRGIEPDPIADLVLRASNQIAAHLRERTMDDFAEVERVTGQVDAERLDLLVVDCDGRTRFAVGIPTPDGYTVAYGASLDEARAWILPRARSVDARVILLDAEGRVTRDRHLGPGEVGDARAWAQIDGARGRPT